MDTGYIIFLAMGTIAMISAALYIYTRYVWPRKAERKEKDRQKNYWNHDDIRSF